MLPSRRSQLQRRDGASSTSAIWISLGAVAVAAILLVLLLNTLKHIRRKSSEPPSWIPTAYLKARWRRWQPAEQAYSRTPLQPQHSPRAPSSSGISRNNTHRAEVDRRQSVRSIMTLPPYHVAPLPSERLIAREGERAGVDTVIEYPESEAQTEARREEEMAALFNIREARRNEQAEREERRDERRRAREAGDWRRLEELEQESRARARTRASDEQAMASSLQAADRGDNHLAQPDSAFLIAELNSIRENASRSRRVSSVSYADLGLARHDGTRIRADSIESERPLLDSAASIGGRRSRATSRASSQGRSRSVIGDQGGDSGRPDISHARHLSDGMASYLSGDSDNEGPPRLSFLTPQSSTDAPPEPPSYEDDVSVHGGDVPPYGEAPPYETTTEERALQIGSPLAHELTRSSRSDEDLHDENELGHEALGSDSSLAQTHARNGANNGPKASNDAADTNIISNGESSKTNPSPSSGPAMKSLALPKLQTKSRVPPAIEVMSATPVNSAPNTPVEAHGRMA